MPDKKTCECGHPERWAADPVWPVEFDERMNEYNLVHDGVKAVMRYCYWCGGRLPESKRSSFFTKPDETERAEVQSLLADAKTAEDVFRVLGSPDETHERKESTKRAYTDTKTIRWKRTFRYLTRWKTLILDVHEMPNGTISYSTFGHPTADAAQGKDDSTNQID